nr:glycine cleavage T C-terminal barrel domain-containing protein [Mesorhizobium sp.]
MTLEIDAVDADASGFEPVWHVGFITSGGYGYTVRKSVALALVDDDFRRGGDGAFGAHCRGRTAGARHPRLTPRPRRQGDAAIEHDPEKWEPVFGKDHAQTRG